MKIYINGKEKEIKANSSLGEVMLGSGFQPEKVVVSINDKVLEKKDYHRKKLNSNDKIDIFSFVGGG